MPPILLVALGGAAGSVARYLLASALNPAPPTGTLPAGTSQWNAFPLGTFVINLVGCALIGLIAGWLSGTAEPAGGSGVIWRPLLVVGVLGGFTTFSAFGMETVLLLRSGLVLPAAIYVVGSTSLGITLAWTGYLLSARA